MSDIGDFIDSISHALETFPVLRFVPHFKKIMAKDMSAMEGIFGFINNNIAACQQVCKCSPMMVIMTCFIKCTGHPITLLFVLEPCFKQL